MTTRYFTGIIGEGFITHEDQEVAGLSFQCHPADVVVVTGENDAINIWAERVLPTEKSKEDAQALINAAIDAAPAMTDPITNQPQAKIQILL